MWAELAAVLALGGTFNTADTFLAPYVYSRWPQGIDGFEHVAVVGDRVADPYCATSGRGVDLCQQLQRFCRSLAHRTDTPEGWIAVRLESKNIGFIASRFVRSPIGYRAHFSRGDGRWQMLMFIAGD